MKDSRCLFVEVEPWEADRIRDKFKHCGVLETSVETLQDTELRDPQGITILSPFIHSLLERKALERLPNLKLVATRSTGLDHIDMEACQEKGVTVCNVPTYGANTVAELCILKTPCKHQLVSRFEG
ncbi:MAG TPA: hypothetical protein VM425_21280 [Myxococcota bacterium]|nr:hypothetical protein [Myxococcota bacterium]